MDSLMLSPLLCLSFVSSATAYYYSTDVLREVECGELLDRSDVVSLPENRSCSLFIENKPESTMLLDIWSARPRRGSCDHISVADLDTNEEKSLCLIATYQSNSKKFKLTLKNLPLAVELGVKYVPRTINCPGQVSQDLYAVPFNISSVSSSECPVYIYPKGVLKLRLGDLHKPNEEVQIEVRQGRHVRRISMSTGIQTLTRNDPLEIPLICGVHVLLISGEATVEAEVVEPSSEVLYSLEALMTCPL